MVPNLRNACRMDKEKIMEIILKVKFLFPIKCVLEMFWTIKTRKNRTQTHSHSLWRAHCAERMNEWKTGV